ncbi:hypothetical protein [Alloactinosynnema sp. L-07]|uniref:hypothetical protein n=1 Tax=Alloactinosynnema sp. L-07 TaxID=1653480 RepID=UPI00065F0AF9|nr:hypothetical protein [Alloactinosynnema sp. L-07]CRK59929.1 hypothetical protein [Alloactinosynnema sp. L-07]
MAEREDSVRRFDPVSLIAGLLTLFASAYVLTDGQVWVPIPDFRWIIAGGAVVIGLLLLLGSTVKGKRK